MLAQVVLRSEQMTSATDLHNPQSAQAQTMQPERIGVAAAAVSFQDVSKQFAAADGSPLEVLRGVSFDLPVGDIVAIVGPSGSGKSTLLNMAAGLLLPDHGRVAVMGQGTNAAVDWSKVGYMFQDDRLLPWRVAIQNVALARSLVGEPDILLMDEPFSRLDAQTRGSMHRELLRIHALRRMSILFVTHDVEEAIILADRVVLMSARPGRVRRTTDISLPQPRLGTAEAVALTAQLRASLEAEPTQEMNE